MADISKVGLPTYLSDYSYEGDPSTATSLVAQVTAGALLVTGTVVATPNGTYSVVVTDIMPGDADSTLVNEYNNIVVNADDTGTIVSKVISNLNNFYLSSIVASASAGPCKVVVRNISGAGTVTNAVTFFSSANPMNQINFPTNLKLTNSTLQVCVTNLAGANQDVYATVMGKSYPI